MGAVVLIAALMLVTKKENFQAPPCTCMKDYKGCLALGNGEDWCKRQGLYCDQNCMWSSKMFPPPQ